MKITYLVHGTTTVNERHNESAAKLLNRYSALEKIPLFAVI
ncbi:MAG: hypothetical protein WC495_01270 [Patescibacteria group bacterium]